MINKILKDIKEAELSAENMINDAEKNALQIIKNATKKVETLKEKKKKEAIQEGEILINADEKMAKEGSENIHKNCKKDNEALNEKSMNKIEDTVKIVTENILEGK